MKAGTTASRKTPARLIAAGLLWALQGAKVSTHGTPKYPMCLLAGSLGLSVLGRADGSTAGSAVPHLPHAVEGSSRCFGHVGRGGYTDSLQRNRQIAGPERLSGGGLSWQISM